ncbi:MAG: histidine phosphatase family protein [Pseudomonadota bacterium]
MTTNGRLGLVRHGQTYANIDRVWHGHTDTELTDLGYQQARELGEYFGNYMQPTVIFASPLQRARITAEEVARHFQLEVHLDERLMEFNLGDWEDKTFESLSAAGENTMRKLVEDPDYSTPNGESQNSVRDRFVTAVDEIVAQHPGEHIVIVAHGVALGIALAHYIDNDTRRWTQYTKKNTAFSELCLETRALLSFNQTEHLSE